MSTEFDPHLYENLTVYVDFDGDTTDDGSDVGEVRVAGDDGFPLASARFATRNRFAHEPEVYAHALAELFCVVEDWGNKPQASYRCRPMRADEQSRARAETLLRQLDEASIAHCALPSPECWREGYAGSFTPEEAVCIDADGEIAAWWLDDSGNAHHLAASEVVGVDDARRLSEAARIPAGM